MARYTYNSQALPDAPARYDPNASQLYTIALGNSSIIAAENTANHTASLIRLASKSHVDRDAWNRRPHGPHVCDEKGCGKAFKRAYDLTQHKQQVHSDERLHVCDEKGCGKAFKRAGAAYPA
ncbi:hypothetical protein B0T20DRAFT_481638 [Sordaria brevicollis]|uniref:C2H2-type domain-containing protein n=1 Tax=Sordaria brevicollis TaxID=83679 RepID=A0AAE0PB26_SORBR|nr:hypothetical protein B0T20DRAFT_481638 [Sordaria brevicollis]